MRRACNAVQSAGAAESGGGGGTGSPGGVASCPQPPSEDSTAGRAPVRRPGGFPRREFTCTPNVH